MTIKHYPRNPLFVKGDDKCYPLVPLSKKGDDIGSLRSMSPCCFFSLQRCGEAA